MRLLMTLLCQISSLLFASLRYKLQCDGTKKKCTVFLRTSSIVHSLIMLELENLEHHQKNKI